MHFVSKSARLHITLRPGISANPLSGQPFTPGVFVRFVDGKATVNDEATVNMMLAHSGFNSDFVSVEETQRDPYANFREEVEPAHSLTEIRYGHVEKTVSSPRARKLPPEMEKFINDRAMEIAKSLLPEMMNQVMEKVAANNAQKAEDTLESEVEKAEAEKVEEILKPKKSSKKPAKNETVEAVEDES